MKISVVTDEISSDLETAMELASDWGVDAVELRGYGENRVPFFSAYQLSRLEDLIGTFNIPVAAISPGLFKYRYPDDTYHSFPVSAIDQEMFIRYKETADSVKFQLNEVLPASFEFAKKIGTNLIGIFSFERIPGMDQPGDSVICSLAEAAKSAEREGMTLVMETEAGHWADTGRHASELVRLVNSPALMINWDPGNSAEAGDIPYPDGYGYVKQFVRHVHFKDVEKAKDGSCRYCVRGTIQWKDQINALKADDYDGYISVETHMRPKISAAKKSIDYLKSILDYWKGY